MESIKYLATFRWLTLACAIGLLASLFVNRHTGLGFFDTSEFSIHIQAGGIAHAPGYPLYLLLGQWLNKFTDDPFLAQHLISLASIALAAWFLYKSFVRYFTQDPWAEAAALVTALLLLSSLYLRRYTMLPEVFLPNIALFAALGWALDRWWASPTPRAVFIIFAIYGLGFAHHHTLALSLPAVLLLFWRKRRLGSAAHALSAVAGFFVGALPILYMLWPLHSPPTLSTYYFIQNFNDLLFVLLRKGYGTFSLSVMHQDMQLSQTFALAGNALLRNFNWVLALLLLPLTKQSARKTLCADPLIVYSGVTLLVFFLWFLPNCTIPLDTAAYRNTFLRFITIPIFLILYFVFHGIRFALPYLAKALKGPGRAFAAAIALVFLSMLPSRAEWSFRHFDFLDEHLREGYQTILANKELSPSGIASGWEKCAIFVRADTLIFSLRYYNQFLTQRHCFIFTPVSFSGQFRARYEEQLQVQSFGSNYAATLNAFKDSPQALMQLFFHRLKDQGYKLYLFYQPDFVSFYNSSFGYRPVGNILELIEDRDQPFSASQFLQLHEEYLTTLEAYLARQKSGDLPSTVIDETVSTGLVQNLIEYRRFNRQLPKQLEEHAHRTEMRLQDLIKRPQR